MPKNLQVRRSNGQPLRIVIVLAAWGSGGRAEVLLVWSADAEITSVLGRGGP